MEPARRAELESAYARTTYAAALPLRLRIGVPSTVLDAFLDEVGHTAWAYLTAWNPGSTARGDAENRAAQAALVTVLRARGLEPHVGAGEPDDGSWPPEPSLLVPGLARADAIALARDLGQNAIVVGVRGGAPELVFVR